MKIHTQKKLEFASGNYVVFADHIVVAILVLLASARGLSACNGQNPHKWTESLLNFQSKRATFLLNFEKRVIGIEYTHHVSLEKDDDWVFNDPTVVDEQTMARLMEGI